MASVTQRITWLVTESAAIEVREIRAMRGEDGYAQDVRDLREYMTAYFEASQGCTVKLGRSVSPIGVTSQGGKILKTRWKYPGAGKSGGLRLCLVAFCDERRVVLCHAAIRRDADDDELIDSASAADGYVDEDGDSG